MSEISDCIFCKIVRNEVNSHKIYEDKLHLAFLDIFPIVKGQTIVITKKHYPSYQFQLSDKVYIKLFLFAKKIGKAIDKSLGSIRTFLVVEGMMVPHAHIKLYPVFKINSKTASRSADKEFLEKWYSGYISTLLGPRANDKDLQKTAEIIRKQF